VSTRPPSSHPKRKDSGNLRSVTSLKGRSPESTHPSPDTSFPILPRSVAFLDGGDVLRLHALLAPGRLVGDLLAFFE
jgi:hypothetical protein